MIRVRFAPSPTGPLHIGGARTYVFNWLFARHNGGQIILRIDDTDIERSTKESLISILEGLEWLELSWDEQHHQSERSGTHHEAAEALLSKGAAYRDFTPQQAVDTVGPKQADSSGPWLANPGMREIQQQESNRRAANGDPFVLRFRVPRETGQSLAFDDLVFGQQVRETNDIEDFALVRSNGSPTYHLASTTDDIELAISHVIRGQDHLTNTFKHILLFKALGSKVPEFAHLPLLLGPDGSKLSKRNHGPAVSVTTYRDRGFLPNGFVNYLSLLGWSPKDDREILTRQQLVEHFSPKDVLRTNAIVSFDESSDEAWTDPKALWINSQHLRQMPLADLMPYVESELRKTGLWNPTYEKKENQWLSNTTGLLRARYTTLRDFSLKGRAYFGDTFEIEPRALKNLNKEDARKLLNELAERLVSLDSFTEESVENQIRDLATGRGVKAGLIINAARAALSGQSVGPSAFSLFVILGQERVVRRLKQA